MDLLVGLTACSAEKSNGGRCKPIDTPSTTDPIRVGGSLDPRTVTEPRLSVLADEGAYLNHVAARDVVAGQP